MEFETPKIIKTEIAGFQKVFIKKINQYLKSMPKVTATSTDREFGALDNYFYGFIWKDVIFHHDKLIERTKKLMRNNKPLAPLSQGRKKKKVVTKIPTAVQNKIDEINKMLPDLEYSENIPGGYFGSTHYSYVELTKPIEVKDNFVIIHSKPGRYNYSFEKRYNVNKKGIDEIGGLDALKYDLNNINKAFKQALKN